MWYISSPEKSVVPWSSGNGVYPSLAVSDGGDNVMVEPGPAIFYLTNPSNSDGEDILIGSAPLGVPTAYGNGIQPSFILPDTGKELLHARRLQRHSIKAKNGVLTVGGFPEVFFSTARWR